MLLRTSEQRYRDEVRMHAEVLQPCLAPMLVSNGIPAVVAHQSDYLLQDREIPRPKGATAPSVLSPLTCYVP